jgi:hypothetical protein
MRIMEIGDTYNAPADCPIPKEHVAVAFLGEKVGVFYPLLCDKREVRLRLLGHALSVEEIKEVADSA